MKTIVIDDQPLVRRGIVDLLEVIFPGLEVFECDTISEGIRQIEAHHPDFILLDIDLPDGTGFDLLEQSSHLDFKVVFITAHETYALQALKSGAIDYVLKPVNPKELKIAIDKALAFSKSDLAIRTEVAREMLNSVREKLVLYLNDGYQVLHIKKLMYCKSDKGYTTFFLSDGTNHIASKTIKFFEEQLPEEYFVRCHQSFLVNIEYISKFSREGYLLLDNKIKIPVSNRKKEEILKRLSR